MPSSIAGRARARDGLLQIGPDRERLDDVPSGDDGEDGAIRERGGDPAVRQQAGPGHERRMLGIRGGKARRHGQRCIARDRLPRPIVGVERLGGARDPGRARRLECLGQALPGRAPARLVVAGAPEELPERFARHTLGVREHRVMRVDVHLVGIDADAQLAAAATRRREESGLQAHRQEGERHIGRRQLDRKLGLLRGGKRQQRAREVGAADRHDGGSRLAAGMITRTGICRVRSAMRAACGSVAAR